MNYFDADILNLHLKSSTSIDLYLGKEQAILFRQEVSNFIKELRIYSQSHPEGLRLPQPQYSLWGMPAVIDLAAVLELTFVWYEKGAISIVHNNASNIQSVSQFSIVLTKLGKNNLLSKNSTLAVIEAEKDLWQHCYENKDFRKGLNGLFQ